jgi:magnesium transporter
LIVLILALILGLSLFIISLAMYRHLYVSLVLGVALLATTLSALFTGLILPFVLRSFKSDPADSSGPLGTMIQDILSIFIYCSVAAWLL